MKLLCTPSNVFVRSLAGFRIADRIPASYFGAAADMPIDRHTNWAGVDRNRQSESNMEVINQLVWVAALLGGLGSTAKQPLGWRTEIHLLFSHVAPAGDFSRNADHDSATLNSQSKYDSSFGPSHGDDEE